jgi:hypothetical protein
LKLVCNLQVTQDDDVTVIDSRCGEDFAVLQSRDSDIAIAPQFDACASWWTQVLDPDLGPRPDPARFACLQFSAAGGIGTSFKRGTHLLSPS